MIDRIVNIKTSDHETLDDYCSELSQYFSDKFDEVVLERISDKALANLYCLVVEERARRINK